MEIGECPKCQRPYTVSEVTGFGILRPRAASDGGPRIEYACLGCGRKITLIPYGEGRYAPPGEPPPPAVAPEARRPPWITDPEAQPRYEAPEPPPAPQADEPEEVVIEDELPPEDTPVGLREALTLLGCSPGASPEEIDRAFRERSRTCHPDKVAHLDPEFQELAERKFKRLRKAYDLLLS